MMQQPPRITLPWTWATLTQGGLEKKIQESLHSRNKDLTVVVVVISVNVLWVSKGQEMWLLRTLTRTWWWVPWKWVSELLRQSYMWTLATNLSRPHQIGQSTILRRMRWKGLQSQREETHLGLCLMWVVLGSYRSALWSRQRKLRLL